ncbi:hypothetical protein [Streptomyces sp. NPDC050600]|uniref:hypothetical protein n=1 Tax=Streptomyces sp. NPDC050600 TaxID=3157213 RepID=UPI00341B6C66
MAALMAAVEPARPVAAPGTGARPDGDDPAAKANPDGVVDRSSPGVTSESFKAPEDLTGAGSDAAGARYKEGVVKTLIRAGATRWAKGGGTANKRLDLEKVKAGAHQVKETRTTTVTKSPGLPARNGSQGAGGGGQNSGGGSGQNSGRNSGRNSTGNGSTGTGRSGSGGATGGGGRGSSGSNESGGSGAGRGTSGNGGGTSPKDNSPKAVKDPGTKGKDGSSGNAGAGGKAGKDGKPGATGSGGGTASGGSSGGNSGASKSKADTGQSAKADLKKGGGNDQGSGGSSGSGGGAGSSGKDGGGSGSDGADDRTPLQRSRETGHDDGSAVRNVVDHVKAYAKGAKDGYQDEKEKNGKEHARLDEAHADHKAKQQDPKKDTPKGTTVTGPNGQTLVIAPPDEGDDGVSTDVKPLLVKQVDANTLTLGTEGARGAISRKELRNFKQYERKLEAKEIHLIKVADACKTLESAAQDEARDCQKLAEQAKAVEGGQKLAAALMKLADTAKSQAAEAAELHKRAQRAAEMCKVVLTNIGTRYAPLYKAVVDSDETKPAELRFYNDKGSYAPAA